MNILDVKVDEESKKDALAKVESFLNETGRKIFTPNPEMLVDAQYDVYFREILNEGDLNICDGVGIQLVSKGKLKRIPGADFMIDICKLAVQKDASIYILGGNDPQTAAIELRKQFPEIRVVGSHKGPRIRQKTQHGRIILHLDEKENNDIIADIVLTAPDIIFVGFGHGKQEKWIYEYLSDLPSVKIAMAVGGSIDFIAGTVKRAPKWVRKAGIEWLYRLILQPWRIRRIYKATIRFLLLYYKKHYEGKKVFL